MDCKICKNTHETHYYCHDCNKPSCKQHIQRRGDYHYCPKCAENKPKVPVTYTCSCCNKNMSSFRELFSIFKQDLCKECGMRTIGRPGSFKLSLV